MALDHLIQIYKDAINEVPPEASIIEYSPDDMEAHDQIRAEIAAAPSGVIWDIPWDPDLSDLSEYADQEARG